MRRWFVLSHLASVHHHLALQHYIAPNIRPLLRAAVVLPAHRERRTATSKSDGDGVSTEAQQLISAEEAARSKRIGQAKRRLEKAARRENRIYFLENSDQLSDAQRAELAGLLRTRENFEEQYSSNTFSAEHVEFKRLHNEAFAALAKFCQRDRKRRRDEVSAGNNDDGKDPNLFYLDGPDAAISSLLIEEHGFDPSSCYSANRHMSTFLTLQKRLPVKNVIHATAAEALTPNDSDADNNDSASFSNVDFSAYYFDGCGGFTPHVIGMMTAALIRPPQEVHLPKTTAVGYSLMGGNRDVVEKELRICRALATIARTKGMRTRHVLDDPKRYGVPNEISKTEGGTFTSWMLLEED